MIAEEPQVTACQARLASLPAELESSGFARIRELLRPEECRALIASYGDDRLYRTTVRMERHHFGRGEYRYYTYPLPASIDRLRRELYRELAPLANAWNEATRVAERYPPELDEYLAACAAAGQRRATPLVLRYGPGDYNALHQDLYGERAFPLQVTVYLSERSEYEGGETILTFGRPRAQSVARALSFECGDALVFPNRYRPVRSARGFQRENVRHGVSLVTAGARYALGLIFHDAR